jgi:hypothetical protein
MDVPFNRSSVFNLLPSEMPEELIVELPLGPAAALPTPCTSKRPRASSVSSSSSFGAKLRPRRSRRVSRSTGVNLTEDRIIELLDACLTRHFEAFQARNFAPAAELQVPVDTQLPVPVINGSEAPPSVNQADPKWKINWKSIMPGYPSSWMLDLLHLVI